MPDQSPSHKPNADGDLLPEKGNPEQVGEIMRSFRDYLVLVARRELRTGLQAKVDASDLVQETFLAAQRDWEQFRGTTERELLAWLKKILQNHMLDVARSYRQTAKRQISRERPLHNPLDSRNHAGQIPAPDRSPRADNIAREEEEALLRAMARLPEDYRQAVQLRNWERLPFQEIGARMGRSADAARKIWSRAVERLQAELEEEFRNDADTT